MNKNNNFGFTLAEVLITLGIIGVVASMTIPVLIGKYQKNESLTRYKKAYTEISQAIHLAEADHGMSETWEWSDTVDLALTQFFADNYFYPYLKVVKKCDHNDESCWKAPVSLSGVGGYLSATSGSTNTLSAIMNGGYSVFFWAGGNPYVNHVQLWVDVDGPYKGPAVIGKDVFGLLINLGESTDKKGIFYAGYGFDRSQLVGNATSGCSKTATGMLAGRYCGGVIIMDGWQMKDDYPW